MSIDLAYNDDADQRTRWQLVRMALEERGRNDDNLYRGFYLPEWAMPILRRETVLSRLWVALMLFKLVVAIALDRQGGSAFYTEEWCVAFWGGRSWQSQEGTFHEWLELRTPEKWWPSRWVYSVEREST